VNSLSPKPADEGLAYYGNITSVVRGAWYRIPEPNPNPFLPPELPDENDELVAHRVFPAPEDWGNFTYHDSIRGNSGRFTLQLSETIRNATIQFVEAKLTVAKENGDSMYDSFLLGVHFPQTGEVVLVSPTPKK
jgi:hypothetical protein